jgi:hypothetical protein
MNRSVSEMAISKVRMAPPYPSLEWSWQAAPHYLIAAEVLVLERAVVSCSVMIL